MWCRFPGPVQAVIEPAPATLPSRPFTTEEELRRRILPPRVEIIADLLPVGAVVISAEPGLGKSFLAMTCEHYLAFGTPMGNWPIQEARRCLVIDFESDDYLVQSRSFAVTPSLPTDTAERIADDAPSVKYLKDEQGFYGITGQTVETRMAVLEAELADAASMGDPYSYVRVDTLKMFIGAPPRAYSGNIYDWENTWCVRLNRLAMAYGVTLVMLHHTNKAGDSSGSTGIAGGVTSLIKMTRNAENKHELILESQKTRAGQPFRCVLIQNSEGKPEFTDAITVSQAELIGLSRQVIDLITARGPQRLRAIQGHFYDVRQHTIRSVVNRLAATGRIQSYLGCWQLVPGPETGRREPVAPPLQPRPCETCGTLMVPMTSPDQRYHASCEPVRAPEPDPDHGQQTDSPPDPDPEPSSQVEVPGRWSAFAALKASIAGSRLHPVQYIPEHERGEGIWGLLSGDDNGVGEQATGEHRWTMSRITQDTMLSGSELAGGSELVAVLDRSGSYPSACSSVTVGAQPLRYTGADGDPRAGGMFLIEPIEWNDFRIGHPLGQISMQRFDRWWISQPHMALLRKLGLDPLIVDSWTSKPVGNLFAQFGADVREERLRAKAISEEAYTEVKRASSVALRSLWSSTRSPFWRPDWSIAIRAEAAVRHWAVAYRAVQAGEICLRLGTVDEACFVQTDPAAGAAWAPAGYKISAAFGGVKHKKDVLISRKRGDTLAVWGESPITLEQFRIRHNLT